MSAPALAFPFISSADKAATVVAPKLKYLVVLVPGETRPPEYLMPILQQRHEADQPVTAEWRGIGLCESRGAANAAIAKLKKDPRAHPRDRWDIIELVENELLSRDRRHFKEGDGPMAAEYVVVRKSELEKIRDELRG